MAKINLNNMFGFLGALFANLKFLFCGSCSYPMGNKIKNIGHHTTKKKIIISNILTKLPLVRLEYPKIV